MIAIKSICKEISYIEFLLCNWIRENKREISPIDSNWTSLLIPTQSIIIFLSPHPITSSPSHMKPSFIQFWWNHTQKRFGVVNDENYFPLSSTLRHVRQIFFYLLPSKVLYPPSNLMTGCYLMMGPPWRTIPCWWWLGTHRGLLFKGE